MSKYKRLDFSSLNYTDEFLSYDEVTATKEPFYFSDEDFDDNGILKIKNAEKEYAKKCVKLEI